MSTLISVRKCPSHFFYAITKCSRNSSNNPEKKKKDPKKKKRVRVGYRVRVRVRVRVIVKVVKTLNLKRGFFPGTPVSFLIKIDACQHVFS